ncbi:hypothetical protein PILCRDRAFT_820096 [Piloderma croceum F 1598]|uniref:Uncharacterized protein n=1 Tax=Piloderma croceum (strain F 1598) TaxID=765440 RepID=A0A0C3FEG1_PILCF|nr:hypothetical protein PILCRDRAFT_820096 [Piloderma croceum F 1598]
MSMNEANDTPPNRENSENSDQQVNSDAATTADDKDTTNTPSDDNSDSEGEGSYSSDRNPEDCWGDLNHDCRLCGTERMFCPGCTGGMISEVGHADLFMGCLVDIRCPLCVGEAEAYEDKDFWQRHYWTHDPEEAKNYTQMQMDDIERKYPGWSNSRETRRRSSLSGSDE